MAAITGTAGGRNGSAPNDSRLSFYQALLAGAIDYPQLDKYVRADATPVNVSMVVNNACNFACRHCYLQVPSLSDRILKEEEWIQIFHSSLESDAKMLSLNGKEVFLGAQGPRLLKILADLRRELAPEKRIGVITNGTLILPHRGLIEEADLTFFDISIDGLPEDHDAVRGKGAFERVKANLQWAVTTLGENAFVSLTAQKQNLARFNEAVLHLNRLGVQNVGVSFFHPAAYNDSRLKLSAEDHDDLFTRLHELAEADHERPLTVFVEVDTLSPQALLAFLKSDWFDVRRIEMDRSRVPWIDYAFQNGLRIQFKFFPIPWAGYHSVRITPEGNVFAVDDIFDTQLYPQRILTTARSHNCDLGAMMRTAQQSPRVTELLTHYHDTLLPEIIAAVKNAKESQRTMVKS